MAIAKKLTAKQQVTEFIQKLEPEQAKVVEYIRQLILTTDAEIAEQIKWNSPSFYYSGEMKAFNAKEYKRDIVVLNLRGGKILLIFPTGAIVNDTNGLLEGNYTDGRRVIHFEDFDEVKSKAGLLQGIIMQWLEKVDK